MTSFSNRNMAWPLEGLSPIVSYVYMQHFENFALDSAIHKPPLWLCYVDATFVVWPHGTEQLWNVLRHLNSLRPTVQFTKQLDPDSATPFLELVANKKEMILATKTNKTNSVTLSPQANYTD
jgi:hypothetical protein